MNDMDDLIGAVEREIETLSNRLSQPSTPKDIKDVAYSLLKTNFDLLNVLYAKRAARFGISAQSGERIAALEAQVSAITQRLDAHESWASKFDANDDTAIIPPETIAKANTDSAFIGGLNHDPSNPIGWIADGKFVENPNHRTHERGTGYPIGQEFASGGTIAGPAPVTIEQESVIPFRAFNGENMGHGC